MAAATELPKMEYTRLGDSGLQVSRICLGMMSYGDPAKWTDWVLGKEEGMPFVQRAIELGINFFDTADVYSGGASEEFTGDAMRAYAKRDEVVVATKCFNDVTLNVRTLKPGQPFPMRPNMGGLSRKHIMQACDDSLKRLGMDYIDLYQYHRFDSKTPVEETVRATHDLIRSGKIRYWGFSSCYAWQFSKVLYTCDQLGCPRPISMQNHYNLVYREEEREMIPLCVDAGISLIPWSPLARGWLTGSRKRGVAEPATARAGSDNFATQYTEQDFDVVEAVERVATRKNVPMAQVALAWMLRKPYMAAPIIGATKMKHLEDAVAALAVKLTDEEVAEMEAPYKPHRIIGHQ